MVVVVTFTEEEFSDVFSFENKDYARGFCGGFTTGAGEYGAGGASGYILPDDEAEMREDEKPAEVERALKAAAKGKRGRK